MNNSDKYPSSVEENFYQILDVPRTASLGEIRKGYEVKLEEAQKLREVS